MTIELSSILSFVAVLVSIVGLMSKNKAQTAKRTEELEKQAGQVRGDVDVLKSRLQPLIDMERRFWQLCSDVDVLKQQMLLFWKDLSIQSAKVLHSPHTPKLDVLIEKFQEDRLTKDELITFVQMLQQLRDNKQETTSRRKVAVDLLTAIHVLFVMGTRFLGTALPRLAPQPDITTLLQEHVDELGTGHEQAAGEAPKAEPPTEDGEVKQDTQDTTHAKQGKNAPS